MRLYRFPLRPHRKSSTTKGSFHCANNYYTEAPIPMAGAVIVEIIAATHAEAYRKLHAAFLPGDPRDIMGKTNVRYFVVADIVPEEEVNRG